MTFCTNLHTVFLFFPPHNSLLTISFCTDLTISTFKMASRNEEAKTVGDHESKGGMEMIRINLLPE